MIKRIILKRGEERRILDGHPWVFDNEVSAILVGKAGAARPAELEAGDFADIESFDKHYLGRAFVNPASKIIARIYSPSKDGMDGGFLTRRIREAVERRACLTDAAETPPGDISCRLVFAEADFLPGLIVDRYVAYPLSQAAALPERPLSRESVRAALGPPRYYYVVQILTAGMEAMREALVGALRAVFGEDAALVEKSADGAREREGLPPSSGVLSGELPPGGLLIFENGLPFAVDTEGGQKTGAFLDQRENRAAAAAFARGRRVLDAFAYSGGFAVHAARAGAQSVVAVDGSKDAVSLIEKNAALNGAEKTVLPVCEDVFEYLTRAVRAKERFGLVILDPPAFAKNRASLPGALRGYKEITMKGLSLLEPGGTLVICSCSFALNEAAFKEMVRAAASDSGTRVVQTAFRSQAACHPVLVGYDESAYLKCGIYTNVSPER